MEILYKSSCEKELIIMMGPIGSGKTTLAKELMNDTSIRISQDEMGRKKYLEVFKDSIEENVPRIIIDRMNFNKKQRERFIKLAKENGYIVTIFRMNTPYEICRKRVLDRTNHPTIKDEIKHLKVDEILKMYQENYEMPEESEYDNYNVVDYVD